MTYIENLYSLKGKTAIVTGAARGIGKGISEALLRAEATVIMCDILEKELISTVTSFKKENLKAFGKNCDLTKKDELFSFVDFVKKSFPRIDVLVNNAGVTYGHSLFDYPEKAWDDTYQIILKAPFELSKNIGKIMAEHKFGVIINITSVSAELGFSNNPAYAAFKGGLKQLSKSLAIDLGKYGIRVNNIGPGYTKTDMTKKSWANEELRKKRSEITILGRWGEPKDLAGLVVFLASDSSSYITGQDIYVDGGLLTKGV